MTFGELEPRVRAVEMWQAKHQAEADSQAEEIEKFQADTTRNREVVLQRLDRIESKLTRVIIIGVAFLVVMYLLAGGQVVELIRGLLK